MQELLERAVVDPAEVAAALPATRAEIVPLHVQDDLTVLNVVWAPGMRIWPHNHLMWADIALVRRPGGQHVLPPHRRPHRGGRRRASCAPATSPRSVTRRSTPWPTRAATFTGAIHVYGGDITSRPDRSEWDQDSGIEVPYDFARAKQYFIDANELAGQHVAR